MVVAYFLGHAVSDAHIINVRFNEKHAVKMKKKTKNAREAFFRVMQKFQILANLNNHGDSAGKHIKCVVNNYKIMQLKQQPFRATKYVVVVKRW